MTTEEAAFIAALDDDPKNHFLREVYADWLEDRNDPRAAGYRAMGRLGKMAVFRGGSYTFFPLYSGCQEFHPDIPMECRIPEPWMDDDLFWEDWPSRDLAESALALKWAKLTPSQQAAILAEAGVTA